MSFSLYHVIFASLLKSTEGFLNNVITTNWINTAEMRQNERNHIMDKWNNHQYRGLLSQQQFIALTVYICYIMQHYRQIWYHVTSTCCQKFRRRRVYKNYLNSSVAFVVLNSGITEGVYYYREKNTWYTKQTDTEWYNRNQHDLWMVLM